MSSSLTDKMKIYIRIIKSGETITLDDVSPNDTILSIRFKIENKDGPKFESIQLKFAGKVLDDNRKLSQYNIQKENTINLNEIKPVVMPKEYKPSYSSGVYGSSNLYHVMPEAYIARSRFSNHNTNKVSAIKIDEKSREKFLNISANKKKEVNDLPSLTNIESEQKAAEQLTENILSKSSNNNLNDRNTLLNILGNIGQQNGKNYLFYDSNKINLSTQQNKKKELKFTLNLNTFEQKVENEVDTAVQLKSCIDNKQQHPILDDFKQKLSRVYNVGIDQIKIVDIFCGTINITYVVDIPQDKIEKYYNENIKGEQQKLSEGLKAQFDQYKDCKMHALLFRDSFDINWFDERGNKTFDSGSTFQVGPKGHEQTYTQPSGWVRFGLKVLNGKYGADNSWLHPFQDPNNWYRCYHGTGSSNSTNGKSVDVMAWIHDGGFNYAGNTAYGPGVYCSPDPKWLENQYVGIHTLNGKKYKFMLQCAVNPDGVRIYQDEHCGKNWQGGQPWGPIWVANHPPDIRPYAILIKEC